MLFSYSAPYAFAGEAFFPKTYPRLLFHRWHLDDDPIKPSCRCYNISGDNRTSVTGSRMYRWTKVSDFPNINGRPRFWVCKMVDVPLWYFLACAISFWNPRTVLSLMLAKSFSNFLTAAVGPFSLAYFPIKNLSLSDYCLLFPLPLVLLLLWMLSSIWSKTTWPKLDVP